MKISLQWLKEYIDLPETPEQIGHILTSTGLEVEKIELFESVKGSLEGLVIGEVLTCGKHPNADRLSVTTVDVGESKPLQIVCGAPNVAAGQKVVVALKGAKLYPAEGESFEIKSSKIRGELSEGMICAADEIGIGKDHDGILVLDTTLANGTPAAEYFNISTDAVFEIGLTPNRADAFSHIGVARDLKAAYKRDLQWPSVDGFKTDDLTLEIPVEVADAGACPRYSSLTMTGIKVAESPSWLKMRLQAIGLTPINNIVDITNFICHEMGQPLHAFDADKISGKKIFVKTLPAGSDFVTLDGKQRKLSAEDLMICDDSGGLCIAGVFGGIVSGITTDTVNLFLESAHFSPSSIRKSIRYHQLNTDASFRFARGTDPEITVFALKRAALLIQSVAGGKISSEISDYYPNPIPSRNITVSDKNIDRLIGKSIARKEAQEILEALDIKVVKEDKDTYTVSVPPYRVDVTQEADIVEEILRIHGFNNVEIKPYASAAYLSPFPAKSKQAFVRTISEQLAASGFYEIWTNSLTRAAYQQEFSSGLSGEPVEILNKLSEELGVMRQTLVFSMLETAAHNINRRQKDLKLFEFGRIYYKQSGAYCEEEKIGLMMTGSNEAANWQNQQRPLTFFDLAQRVVEIFEKCGLQIERQPFNGNELFDFGVQIRLNGNLVGTAGRLKTSAVRHFGIKQEIFYAELDTILLFNEASPKLVIQEVPKYPAVERDLSLVIDRQVRFEEILQLAQKTEQMLIKDVSVFDVYEGKNLPEGKKAYAMKFTLQNYNKTLTDTEIENVMGRLMNEFETRLGAIIRK